MAKSTLESLLNLSLERGREPTIQAGRNIITAVAARGTLQY